MGGGGYVFIFLPPPPCPSPTLSGHMYYFIQEELPHMEGPLKGVRLLRTPQALYNFLQLPRTDGPGHTVGAAARAAQAPTPQRQAWGAGRVLGGQ